MPSPPLLPPSSHLPIFWLTDFGLTESWTGVMKAVALRLGFAGAMVDLTHGIAPQDLIGGMMALDDALPFLPEACVVIAVVDPGVGSSRRPLLAQTGARFFIGPDNGLLTPAITAESRCCEIIAHGPINPAGSATFHGRDVFTPAGALAAMGHSMESLGRPIIDPTLTPFPTPHLNPDGTWTFEIIHIDHFGNLTTCGRSHIAPFGGMGTTRGHVPAAPPVGWHLLTGPARIAGLSRTFADVSEGQPVAYFNASGWLEVAIRNGNAQAALGVNVGDTVTAFRPAGCPAP